MESVGHHVARNTVKNVHKTNGLNPAPGRGERTAWETFLKSHWEIIAAGNFFTTKVWTARGRVTDYTLFVIERAAGAVQVPLAPRGVIDGGWHPWRFRATAGRTRVGESAPVQRSAQRRAPRLMLQGANPTSAEFRQRTCYAVKRPNRRGLHQLMADRFCHLDGIRGRLPCMDRSEHMTTMNISLPESLRTFVEQRAATGFGSASEYIRTLLREDQKRSAQEHLEHLLLEGINSGPAEPWTVDDWTELRQHIRATAAKKLGARGTKD